MRDHQNIVRFRQRSDLLAGGNAAHSAYIGADILAGVTGHQDFALPQVDGALAGGDRHPDLACDLGHGIHIVGRNGIFQNHRAVRLDGAAESDCLRQGHAAVDFQNEIKIRADRFTADTHLFHFPLDPAGEELALAVRRACGAVAEDLCCGKAHLLQLLILSRQLVLVLGDVHHRGVDPHLVTGLAAQQLVDGDAQSLALDVPQRNVDGRDRAHNDRTTEIDRTQEVLVEVLDAEGVFPDQVVREFFNGRCSCLQIAPVARFTQTYDTGIGVDLNKEIMLCKAKLYICDFHGAFLLSRYKYYKCCRKNLQCASSARSQPGVRLVVNPCIASGMRCAVTQIPALMSRSANASVSFRRLSSPAERIRQSGKAASAVSSALSGEHSGSAGSASPT